MKLTKLEESQKAVAEILGIPWPLEKSELEKELDKGILAEYANGKKVIYTNIKREVEK